MNKGNAETNANAQGSETGESVMESQEAGHNNSEPESSTEASSSSSETAARAEVGTLDNPSAYGSNPDLLGFNQSNLDDHWAGGKSDHSDQYPEFTKEQYAQRAHDLVRSPTSDMIDGYVATTGRFKGTVVRFDKDAKDWVRSGEKGLFTMFKPNEPALAYFEKIRGYET